MKFFIIRMNDFTPEEWPVVSLPYNKNSNAKQSKEACKKLIEELGSDDGIIIVEKCQEAPNLLAVSMTHSSCAKHLVEPLSDDGFDHDIENPGHKRLPWITPQ